MKHSLSILGSRTRAKTTAATVALLVWLLYGQTTFARIPPISPPDANGFRWATITHPGNPGYDGPSPYGPPRNFGRGRVDYTYQIAQQELSSPQWVEFVNTFSTQANFPFSLFGYRSFTYPPLQSYGIWQDDAYTGPGRRYVTTVNGQDVSDRPVFGISWRDAALYCNWLHNGKSSNPASLLNGAYDTSTWGMQQYPAPRPGFFFTDRVTHEVGAKFWIPTLDEWLKAGFYDPDKNGEGQGGWWRHLNRSDAPPISGLPGTPGATTSGGDFDYYTALNIPLGAYPDALSPWGLLDTASGGNEWIEEPFYSDPDQPYYTNRGLLGTFANDTNYAFDSHVSVTLGANLVAGDASTLRIASIPSPSAVFAFLAFTLLRNYPRSTRRRENESHSRCLGSHGDGNYR